MGAETNEPVTDRIEAIRERHESGHWTPASLLREHVAVLLAEVEEAREDAAHWEAEYDIAVGGAESLKMALARVEALAKEWEGWAALRSTPRIDTFRDAAESLRAAVTGPEAEEPPC